MLPRERHLEKGMLNMEIQLAHLFKLRAQKMAHELIHEASKQGTSRLEAIVGGHGIPLEISCLIRHLEYIANGVQAL